MIFTHFTTQTITAPSYSLTQRFLRCLIWICSVETKRKEYKEQQIPYPNGFLHQERRLLAHCHLQKVWNSLVRGIVSVSPPWLQAGLLSPAARVRGCGCWLIRDSQTKSKPTFGCQQDCGAPLPLQSGCKQHPSTSDSSAAPGPWTRGRRSGGAPGAGAAAASLLAPSLGLRHSLLARRQSRP